MNLLKIIFAIVVGAIAYGLMQWLTTAPHDLEVLTGIAVGVIAYFSYPNIKL